jgi:NAD(P)-dependent dehydrogenase (short-subunit alcohol dehydrogenase family)
VNGEQIIKRILITGANKGIGLATVRALLTAHEDVAVLLGSRDTARGRAAIESLCEEHPDWDRRLHLLEIDVADPRSVQAARDTVASQYEAGATPLYGIVNNAGIGLASDDMQGVLNVNLLGVKRVCDAFIPLLQPAGRVVNVSSASGPRFVSQCAPQRQLFFQDPSVEWRVIQQLAEDVLEHAGDAGYFRSLGLGEPNAYGFSKACVSLYTLLLAREHPQLCINACTPGYIETDLTRPQAQERGVSTAEMGMKAPEFGTGAAHWIATARRAAPNTPATDRGDALPVEVGLHGLQHDLRAGSPLVVLRHVDPEHPAVGIHQQGSRDGQRRGIVTRGRGMEALVAQAEGIGHHEVRIRKHDRLQPVEMTLFTNFFRVIGTDSYDLDAALFKLGPKLLPSP